MGKGGADKKKKNWDVSRQGSARNPVSSLSLRCRRESYGEVRRKKRKEKMPKRKGSEIYLYAGAIAEYAGVEGAVIDL